MLMFNNSVALMLVFEVLAVLFIFCCKGSISSVGAHILIVLVLWVELTNNYCTICTVMLPMLVVLFGLVIYAIYIIHNYNCHWFCELRWSVLI